MNSNISILLILKDRTPHTHRLLTYLKLVQCNWPIVIADGGSEDLELDKKYPELNIDYIKYPFDKTLTEFHNKMADAIDHVQTQLTVSVDNDDFYFNSGLTKDIEFLRTHPSYTSSRGSVDKFVVSNGCYGTITEKGQLYKRPSIIGETAAERISSQSKLWNGAWHNVIRTKDLRCTLKIINIVNPSCFRFTEQCMGFLNSLFGNSNRDNHKYMLHQSNVMSILPPDFLIDKYQWVKSSHWPENFQKMKVAVGTCMAWCDDLAPLEGWKLFREAYLLKNPEMNNIVDPQIKESLKIKWLQPYLEMMDKILDLLDEINPKEQDPINPQVPFAYTPEQELTFMRNACQNK